MAPAEDQHITRPSVSVIVICVLLNDAAMCTYPCGTTRRSRFFLNSFLRFVAAAGFPGAPVSGAVPAAFGSFATFHSDRAIKSETLPNDGECRDTPEFQSAGGCSSGSLCGDRLPPGLPARWPGECG